MSAWEIIARDSGKLWRNRQKMQVAKKKCKQKPNTGNEFMRYSDIIAREVETLPLEKQIEILDFIAFLKTRQVPVELDSEPITPKTAEEIESFFRSFNVDTSGYIFSRDDANAR